MADLSTLSHLTPAKEPTDFDPTLSDTDGHVTNVSVPAAPREPPRFTDFQPRQRGVASPVVGFVTDAAARRALAASGEGWINEDGRVLANGSCNSMNALRSVPDAAPIFTAWKAAETALRARLDATLEEALADHRASGRSAAHFRFDGSQLDESGPERDAVAAIRRAGWTAIVLRQDRGTKEIVCPNLNRPLASLATELGCRVVAPGHAAEPRILFDPASAPAADPAPRPVATTKTFEALKAQTVAKLLKEPGYKSFDLASGTFEIEGRGRIQFFPAVSLPDEEESPTPSF